MLILKNRASSDSTMAIFLAADNSSLVVNISSGYADSRTNEPNKPGLLFNLASIAKVITATGFLQKKLKKNLILMIS
jgi:CubicO group peptidase (beta-lactamase class C family)